MELTATEISRWAIVAIFLAGSIFHRLTRWGGWVHGMRQDNPAITYRDYLHDRGPLALKDLGITVVMAFLYAAGALTATVQAGLDYFSIEAPKEPDSFWQIAIALTAGFGLSFGASEVLSRWETRKATKETK